MSYADIGITRSKFEEFLLWNIQQIILKNLPRSFFEAQGLLRRGTLSFSGVDPGFQMLVETRIDSDESARFAFTYLKVDSASIVPPGLSTAAPRRMNVRLPHVDGLPDFVEIAPVTYSLEQPDPQPDPLAILVVLKLGARDAIHRTSVAEQTIYVRAAIRMVRELILFERTFPTQGISVQLEVLRAGFDLGPDILPALRSNDPALAQLRLVFSRILNPLQSPVDLSSSIDSALPGDVKLINIWFGATASQIRVRLQYCYQSELDDYVSVLTPPLSETEARRAAINFRDQMVSSWQLFLNDPSNLTRRTPSREPASIFATIHTDILVSALEWAFRGLLGKLPSKMLGAIRDAQRYDGPEKLSAARRDQFRRGMIAAVSEARLALNTLFVPADLSPACYADLDCNAEWDIAKQYLQQYLMFAARSRLTPPTFNSEYWRTRIVAVRAGFPAWFRIRMDAQGVLSVSGVMLGDAGLDEMADSMIQYFVTAGDTPLDAPIPVSPVDQRIAQEALQRYDRDCPARDSLPGMMRNDQTVYDDRVLLDPQHVQDPQSDDPVEAARLAEVRYLEARARVADYDRNCLSRVLLVRDAVARVPAGAVGVGELSLFVDDFEHVLRQIAAGSPTRHLIHATARFDALGIGYLPGVALRRLDVAPHGFGVGLGVSARYRIHQPNFCVVDHIDVGLGLSAQASLRSPGMEGGPIPLAVRLGVSADALDGGTAAWCAAFNSVAPLLGVGFAVALLASPFSGLIARAAVDSTSIVRALYDALKAELVSSGRSSLANLLTIDPSDGNALVLGDVGRLPELLSIDTSSISILDDLIWPRDPSFSFSLADVGVEGDPGVITVSAPLPGSDASTESFRAETDLFGGESDVAVVGSREPRVWCDQLSDFSATIVFANPFADFSLRVFSAFFERNDVESSGFIVLSPVGRTFPVTLRPGESLRLSLRVSALPGDSSALDAFRVVVLSSAGRYSFHLTDLPTFLDRCRVLLRTVRTYRPMRP